MDPDQAYCHFNSRFPFYALMLALKSSIKVESRRELKMNVDSSEPPQQMIFY